MVMLSLAIALAESSRMMADLLQIKTVNKYITHYF